MGSLFVSKSFEASDESCLQKQYSFWLEDEVYSHGHDPYSGVLKGSLKISHMAFPDFQKAQEYVSDNTNKHGQSLAVKVGDFSKSFAFSPKGKKLLEKQKAIAEELENFDLNLLNKLRLQKSAYKACPSCESKINVQAFVKNHKKTTCPVCQKDFLKTQALKDKELKLIKALSEIKHEVAKEKALFKEKNKKEIGWYVGGWASS